MFAMLLSKLTPGAITASEYAILHVCNNEMDLHGWKGAYCITLIIIEAEM